VSNRRKERERRRRLAHAEVVPREEREPRPEREPKAARKSGGGTRPARKPVPAPSLQRSLKRGALVLVVLSALIYLVDGGKHSIGADVLQASLGAVFFIPFDFLLTRVMFNRMGKRFNS
jgi:hypothetical protein